MYNLVRCDNVYTYVTKTPNKIHEISTGTESSRILLVNCHPLIMGNHNTHFFPLISFACSRMDSQSKLSFAFSTFPQHNVFEIHPT